MDIDSATLVVLGALMFGWLGNLVFASRLMRRAKVEGLSPAKGSVGYGVFYAFGKGMLPWNKESGQLHPVAFWAGVLFHVGIFAAFLLVFERLIFANPGSTALQVIAVLPALGAVLGAINLVRRLFERDLREFSVPDDFVSLALTLAFMAGACTYALELLPSIWFDAATVAVMVYLPLSKIRHMVTFFVTRYYHGEQYGMLGIYRPGAKPASAPYDPNAIRAAATADAPEHAPSDNAPTFSAESCAKLAVALDEEMTRQSLAQINTCVHCGMCEDACHYYLSTGDRSLIPVAKLDKVADAFRGHHSVVGAVLPALVGARKLTPESAGRLHQTVFEHCTLCGRCGLTCPMGINTGEVLYSARNAFAKIGATPIGLQKPARTAIDKGNYLGLPNDEVAETIEWLGEELSDDLEVEDLKIPIDKQDADVLFIPHPLELRDFPMTVMAAAKIFYRAGVSYTFSAKHFDTVNYAYYGGEKDHMTAIVQRLVDVQKELRATRVVLSPCGHGYRVLRWEAERLLGQRFDFEVCAFSEIMDEYIRDGKLTPKLDLADGPVTYHDPCNLARRGGVIEEPRRVLAKLTSNLVEMTPTGAMNYCCGGGGGLSASGEYGATRLRSGRAKVEQIKATGARLVVTNCFNCNTQIKELNRKHDLGIEVKNITEVLADSLG